MSLFVTTAPLEHTKLIGASKPVRPTARRKNNLCLLFDHGVVDLALQCEGAHCAGTTPFLLTSAFDYTLGAFGEAVVV